jgi:hypothetical protein
VVCIRSSLKTNVAMIFGGPPSPRLRVRSYEFNSKDRAEADVRHSLSDGDWRRRTADKPTTVDDIGMCDASARVARVWAKRGGWS